jgi:hypothetical protein
MHPDCASATFALAFQLDLKPNTTSKHKQCTRRNKNKRIKWSARLQIAKFATVTTAKFDHWFNHVQCECDLLSTILQAIYTNQSTSVSNLTITLKITPNINQWSQVVYQLLVRVVDTTTIIHRIH